MRYLNYIIAFMSGKKQWLAAMLLSVSTWGAMAQISSFPYSEDFEVDDGGWVAANNGATDGWEWGVPAGSFISSANSGSNAWVTNLDGNYPSSAMMYLVSPEFDFSSFAVDPVLSFHITYALENNYDFGWIEYSTDSVSWYVLGSTTSGINWYDFSNGWNGESGWKQALHSLTGMAGEPSVYIRFRMSSDGSINQEGIGIDDIVVQEAAPELGVTSVLAPIGTNLTSSEQISFTVQAQFETIDAFSATIEITGPVSASINENFSSLNIPAGGEETFYISEIDFSVPGSYEVKVTITPSDMYPDNNSKTIAALNLSSTVSTFPYFEDFETNDGEWMALNFDENGWEHGEPNASRISSAYSGNNAWVTNLDGNFSVGSVYYLYSPQFDLSEFEKDPELSFYMYRRIGSSDAYAYMEYSIDGGNSWNVLGDQDTGLNWYNSGQSWFDNSGWTKYAHILTGLAGQPSVILRLVLNTEYAYAVNEGLGVDDFSIREATQPDIAIVGVDVAEGLQFTDNESFFVTVAGSILDVSTIDMYIDIYGPENSSYSKRFTNVGLVPGNTTVLEFEGIDISSKGAYQIYFYISTPVGDFNPNNNNHYISLFHRSDVKVTSFPYRQDFENGEAGWFPNSRFTDEDANDDFALGIPAGPVINSAASGNYAWKTNLIDALTSQGEHYLYSPEFDFSSFGADPYISFSLNYQMNPNFYDYMYLQYSINQGNSWNYVGYNDSGGVNWYNGNYYVGWDESSGGWVQATHVLSGLTGYPSVMFRFVFSVQSTPENLDGVAIDNIKIGTLEAIAGDDQILCGATSHKLSANTPFIGAGEWTVESGTGGSFANPSIPNTTFTGVAGETYTLRWTVTPGGSYMAYDEVVIEFNTATPPTTADAGEDISICSDDAVQSTTLNANLPTEGTGEWSFVSGTDAILDDAFANNSGIESPAGKAYVLRWTITNTAGCTSTDDVRVTFSNYPAKPTIDVQSGPTLIASPAHEYEWFRNGQPVAGTSRELFLEEGTSGSYTVKVKVYGCESEISDPLDIVVTAADNETLNAGVSTFPNPVKDKLTVKLGSVAQSAVVQLTDARGLVISEHHTRQGQSQLEIDTSSMSEGLYLVWITSGKLKVCQKVIKSNK